MAFMNRRTAAVLLAVCLIGTNANADADKFGMKLMPVRQDAVAVAGEVGLLDFRLGNTGSEAIDVTIDFSDTTRTEDGPLQLRPAGSTETGCGLWLETKSKQVRIESESWADVEFKVSVPAHSVARSYYCGVSAKLSPQESNSGVLLLSPVARISPVLFSLVVVTVGRPGLELDLSSSLSVLDVKINSLDSADWAELEVRVRNRLPFDVRYSLATQELRNADVIELAANQAENQHAWAEASSTGRVLVPRRPFQGEACVLLNATSQYGQIVNETICYADPGRKVPRSRVPPLLRRKTQSPARPESSPVPPVSPTRVDSK